MSDCFSCHKKLGIINNWRDEKHIREYGYQPPEGMSKHDKLCASCLDIIVNPQKTSSKITAVKSPKSIKIDFYLTVITIIGSSFMIISGLTGENPIGIMLGLPALIISLIQLPKRKKQFDGLSKTSDEPLSVLKMRLAKGEITKEEFDKIKEDLK